MQRIFEELMIGDTFFLNVHGIQFLMVKVGLDRALYLPKLDPDTLVDKVDRLDFDITIPN